MEQHMPNKPPTAPDTKPEEIDEDAEIDEEIDEDAEIDPPEHLTGAEERDLLEADPTPALLNYTGQDFDVNGLVRRMQSDDILIPTFGHEDARISSAGFQRSFVWKRPQMDRFIESLLLGYPIPGIFLVRQGDRRYLVLDGHQRLRTLEHFVEGVHDDKTFVLKNVAEAFRGLTYKTLPEERRRIFDDTFIPATIVATDGSPESLEAVYQIFERLNSGGTQLTPHEVRVALFAGPFIDFLDQLNRVPEWRALYGAESPRLRDQELVLRILALLMDEETYRRPLKTFLNKFVGAHRKLDGVDSKATKEIFVAASSLLLKTAGREFLRPGGTQLNAAFTEAVFVGLMTRLATGKAVDEAHVGAALHALGNNADLEAATTRATADEEVVRQRLAITKEGLAGI
jgi:hypothetical protein